MTATTWSTAASNDSAAWIGPRLTPDASDLVSDCRRIYGDCSRPFSKLAFSCGGRYDIASTTTDTTQRLFAADQNVIYPYGVDPVFLR